MPYSHSLADRVRHALHDQRDVAERKMFGGVCFMLQGNMLVGLWEKSLIVRLGPEQAAQALQEDHVREFNANGRPMRGWIVVEPNGMESDRQLAGWIDRAMKFVETLPAK